MHWFNCCLYSSFALISCYSKPKKDTHDTPNQTTHVGSLPRSQDVVDFIFAREKEEDYDQSAFDTTMTQAVDETVKAQKEAEM